ncbi:keratin-like protein KRT222 [Ambystoma mexicanum]|uniref:keratin-like protein KRT222 n=1 Tax=Ambystoma mexicanum TaxID=8296 RepID=UPI0037E9A81B
MNLPSQPRAGLTPPGLEHFDTKVAMKQLNERLADYMAHVASLEESNLLLERKIVQHVRKNKRGSVDWSQKEKLCQDLRHSISQVRLQNASLAMAVHSKEMDLNHLKARSKMEHAYCKHLGMKMEMLQEMRAEISQQTPVLEGALEEACRENAALTSDHEEAVRSWLQSARPGDEVRVAVEEDGSGMALSQKLSDLRACYEELLFSTRIPRGLPAAHAQLEKEATKSLEKDEENLKEARAELKAAQRQWRNLQVEVESLYAMEKGLHMSLYATEQQYQSQRDSLGAVINGLEAELHEVRQGMRSQLQQHEDLLNTKMRLEKEIQTYRSLLEKEEHRFVGSNHSLENGSAEQSPRKSKSGSLSPAKMLHNEVIPNYTRAVNTEKALKEEHEAVKKPTVLNGKIVKEGAEACGTIQTENVDKIIKQWEGSFFKDNPHLRKKSVSLRFDLHLEPANGETTPTPTGPDGLPDIEVRLVMRRSCSSHTISQ